MRRFWGWVEAHISPHLRTSGSRGLRFPEKTALLLGQWSSLMPEAPRDWHLVTAANLEDAQNLLARQEIPVVLCGGSPPGGNWKRAVRTLADARGHPSVVLLTQAGRPPGWTEVSAAGGYDVLKGAVNGEVLERTLRSARSHWLSRRTLESESRHGTPKR